MIIVYFFPVLFFGLSLQDSKEMNELKENVLQP